MPEQAKRAYKRRLRAWRFIRPLAAVWLRLRYGYRHEGDEQLAAVEGPLIVVINHTNALDPLFTGVAFKRPLSFVASEHLMRIRPWGRILDRYICLIPHKKGSGRTGTSRVCLQHIARGESVFLCAEGEQTWDGISGQAKPHTGSFIKRSGATLVTYLIEGAYLARPRWSRADRRGKVFGHPVRIYGPDTLAGMSEYEIEEAVNRDLSFDVWQWQQEMPGGPVRYRCSRRKAAAGLEKAVCACPVCGRIGRLKTKGDRISCDCGFSLRWSRTGFFEPAEPFQTIVQWEVYDREVIGRFLSESEGEWPADRDVTLRRIGEHHRDKTLCQGELKIECSGETSAIAIGPYKFGLSDISKMAMVLDRRIVFTADENYYELRAENANLKKYLTAWEWEREGEF